MRAKSMHIAVMFRMDWIRKKAAATDILQQTDSIAYINNIASHHITSHTIIYIHTRTYVFRLFMYSIFVKIFRYIILVIANKVVTLESLWLSMLSVQRKRFRIEANGTAAVWHVPLDFAICLTLQQLANNVGEIASIQTKRTHWTPDGRMPLE